MAYPDPLRQLLREMQLIASVPKEHKVNFQSFSYVPNTLGGNLYRYLTGESHHDLLRRLRECLRLTGVYRHEYPQYTSELVAGLTKVASSFETYRELYRSKVDALIDLDLLERELKLVLEELERK